METPLTTKLERGCIVTILVTIILLARPIGVFVHDLYRKDANSALVSGGLAGLICIVGWLLWTGVPHFRWVAVGVLAVSAAVRFIGFIFSASTVDSVLAGAYGVLSIWASIALIVSPSVRAYLRQRES